MSLSKVKINCLGLKFWVRKERERERGRIGWWMMICESPNNCASLSFLSLSSPVLRFLLVDSLCIAHSFSPCPRRLLLLLILLNFHSTCLSVQLAPQNWVKFTWIGAPSIKNIWYCYYYRLNNIIWFDNNDNTCKLFHKTAAKIFEYYSLKKKILKKGKKKTHYCILYQDENLLRFFSNERRVHALKEENGKQFDLQSPLQL